MKIEKIFLKKALKKISANQSKIIDELENLLKSQGVYDKINPEKEMVLISFFHHEKIIFLVPIIFNKETGQSYQYTDPVAFTDFMEIILHSDVTDK